MTHKTFISSAIAAAFLAVILTSATRGQLVSPNDESWLTDQAAESFPELSAAYDSAKVSRAAEFAPKTWAKASEAFQTAIRTMNAGKLEKSRKQADAALPLLKKAELEALLADHVEPAKETLKKAEKINAAKLAPRTFAQAQASLQQARQAILDDRYKRKVNRELADQAAYDSRHALFLAERISRLKKDDDWEAPILEGESEIADLSSALERKAQFDQGLNLPVEAMRGDLRNLLDNNRRLQQEAIRNDSLIGALEAENLRLRSQSGQYASELESKRQELDRQKRFDDKVNRVVALFKPSDGVVLREEDRLVIRLTGLSFPSGKADLKPPNYELLERVQQALAEFPERRIEVQGHTDAQGKEEKNLELSQKRAEAVRAYLIEKMKLLASKISAAGFGSSRAVSDNDTPTGRALNRRIEIILIP
jgi:outer membrane protein OmpA-like peptidoglycan-associated protein